VPVAAGADPIDGGVREVTPNGVDAGLEICLDMDQGSLRPPEVAE